MGSGMEQSRCQPPGTQRAECKPMAHDEDFTQNRIPPVLVRQLHRRAGAVEMKPETIAVTTLRAIEPLVARYLDKQPRRRQLREP